MKNQESKSIESKGNQSIIENKIDKINSNESIKSIDNQFKSDLYISYNGSPSSSQRSKLRSQLSGYMKRILSYDEKKDQENRNQEIEKFKIFYKENYLKNDYSLRSLYHGSSGSSQYEIIGDFLGKLKRLKSIDLEIK